LRELLASLVILLIVGSIRRSSRPCSDPDHPPDNHQLLEVLLTEKGGRGFNDIEQLRDHGGHAAEMARPRCRTGERETDSTLRRSDIQGYISPAVGAKMMSTHFQRLFHCPVAGCAGMIRNPADAELGRIDKNTQDEKIVSTRLHKQ
jgi:hypothetical protein